MLGVLDMNNLLFVLPLLLLIVAIVSSFANATTANTTIATSTPTEEQIALFNSCMQEQNANGTYNLTPYTTLDLSADGTLIPSVAEPDRMLTEKELRNEWNEQQDLYKGDCFQLSDMTPQQLKRAYGASGFG
jgi:hypothetical protein